MKPGATIYFTVTNELSFDQRMIRICSSLSSAGYEVVLIGRSLKNAPALLQQPFKQHRLHCFFTKSFLFYAEYNVRLFFFLLGSRMDLICAIDLDTILPCLFISRIKKIPRVYDAHELFCEMKEVVTRPIVHRIWKLVERYAVPRFTNAYTVNNLLASEFQRMYGHHFEIIRNLPLLMPLTIPEKKSRYILYQGSVNEGRCFETLIAAIRGTGFILVICGNGNFEQQAKKMVIDLGLSDQVRFEGKKQPGELRQYTLHAWIGITLFENKGLSNYLSLGNRFFDYMHAAIPQLCVGYPAYREINRQSEVALLISDCSESSIRTGLEELATNDELSNRLQQNCLVARERFCWQQEEQKLISFYREIEIRR